MCQVLRKIIDLVIVIYSIVDSAIKLITDEIFIGRQNPFAIQMKILNVYFVFKKTNRFLIC